MSINADRRSLLTSLNIEAQQYQNIEKRREEKRREEKRREEKRREEKRREEKRREERVHHIRPQ